MMSLILRSLGGLVFLLALIGAPLFFGAGTMAYPEAWTFLAVFGGGTLLITIYLMIKDRALLERRSTAGAMAEARASQRIIQNLASLSFIGIFIVSALDRRFAWSGPPDWIVIVGEIMVALGLLFVFLVFRENSYASSTIEIADDQRIVTTGPYGVVRHPMYAGALFLVFGAPLALGSYWGLIPAAVLMVFVILRLLDEERFLEQNLVGYRDYRAKVRSRLVPLVW
jgi:protein-S-isoprenylcysteine O-methyltransferase Ste14